MRAVNLLPADHRRKSLDASARTPLLVAGAGIALVTVAATLVASLAALDASDTRSRLEAVEKAIAELPQPEQTAVNAAELAQERADRSSALAAALTGRVSFDRLLRQISLVLPDDAWLTQLEAAAPTVSADPAAAADDSAGVTIQGATWTHDRVAVVLARLAAIPTLTNVRLTGTTRVAPQEGESGEGKPVRPHVTFVVSASVRTGEGS